MQLVSFADCETSCIKIFRCHATYNSQPSFRDKLQKAEESFTSRNTFSCFPLATFKCLSDGNLSLGSFLHPPMKCPADFESETNWKKIRMVKILSTKHGASKDFPVTTSRKFRRARLKHVKEKFLFFLFHRFSQLLYLAFLFLLINLGLVQFTCDVRESTMGHWDTGMHRTRNTYFLSTYTTSNNSQTIPCTAGVISSALWALGRELNRFQIGKSSKTRQAIVDNNLAGARDLIGLL